MRTRFDVLGALLDRTATGSVPDPDGDCGGRRLRALFISDVHLGTPECQAAALLDFLQTHPSDYLYLVGDIVHVRQLQRHWYWPQSHNDIVQALLRRARQGCRIVYIPGRHDGFARQFTGRHFGGIDIQDEAVHTTAMGHQLWVTDGNVLGGVTQWAWRLAGLRHDQYVTRFEVAAVQEAMRGGHQGVVCGHVRRADVCTIGGAIYCNAGDWIESRTALAENYGGRLQLVRWSPSVSASVL